MDKKKGKRVRCLNFSERENHVLIAAVKERYETLKNVQKVAEVSKKKRQAWMEVAEEVNSVRGNFRTWEAVTKR
jgi:hypothetical protein